MVDGRMKNKIVPTRKDTAIAISSCGIFFKFNFLSLERPSEDHIANSPWNISQAGCCKPPVTVLGDTIVMRHAKKLISNFSSSSQLCMSLILRKLNIFILSLTRLCTESLWPQNETGD